MKKKDKKLADPSDETTKEKDDKDTEEIEEVRNSVQILENRAERFQNQAVEEYRRINELIERDPRFGVLFQSDSAAIGRNN